MIEDDEAVRETLGIVLGSEGFSVDLTADSTAGLRALNRIWPDVLLLDLTLGQTPGEEVYQQILSEFGSAPPTVILSAAHNARGRIGAFSARTDILLLPKPYSIDALLEAIRNITQSQKSVA